MEKINEKLYNKILIAKNSIINKCFAEEGELLLIASEKNKKKIKLAKDSHYFVGAISNEPSIFGWVKNINQDLSLEDIKKYYNLDFSKDEKANSNFKLLLDSIDKFNENTPMACSYYKIIGVDKTEKKMHLHKVIFYYE